MKLLCKKDIRKETLENKKQKQKINIAPLVVE